MKRLLWLLAAVTLFLAACGGATSESAVPTAETYGGESTAPATASDATTASAGDTQADAPAAPAATADPNDPTQVRDRDWKLNDVTEPAVTVIEYGDFQ